MSEHRVSDINVLDSAVLPAPEYLCREIRRTEANAAFVADARASIQQVIFGNDPRLLVIVGPCSIHDTDAGLEYAAKLALLNKKVGERLLLVMRVYFEKPRTTIGWKGLIMDPHLDGSHDIPEGLKTARRFLKQILEKGLPTATEFLDPITPQYIADLVCWSAIGARTTESQTHRQMASGLSMPLGFKNGTAGSVQVAINAIKAARAQQTFLGISHQGLASAVTTRGNPSCHVILRGGSNGPNYDEASVAEAVDLLRDAGLPTAIMVDCSHDNSGKDTRLQPDIARHVVGQLTSGNRAIIGLMIESNLVEGKQPFPQPKGQLVRGLSITDSCIGWSATEDLLQEIHQRLGDL